MVEEEVPEFLSLPQVFVRGVPSNARTGRREVYLSSVFRLERDTRGRAREIMEDEALRGMSANCWCGRGEGGGPGFLRWLRRED